MATFRELRDKLNSLSDVQLDQEIKIISKGYSVNAPLDVRFENGVMKTKLDLFTAEFDLWYDTDPYHAGVPEIPWEDIYDMEDEDMEEDDMGGDGMDDEDTGEDGVDEDSGIMLLGIGESMPYLSLHDADWHDHSGFTIN